MDIAGKRVRRTRFIQTEQFIIAVDVEAIIPDEDPSEPCFEPNTIALLRDVEAHAQQGDREWLIQRGRVYQRVNSA